MFEKFKNYFKPKVEVALAESSSVKSSSALPDYVTNYQSGGGSPSTTANYTTYQTSDLVNSCVNYISETAGLTKFKIMQKDQTGRLTPLKNKKVRELFEGAPNPYYTWQELIEQITQSYLLSGNAFLSFEPIANYELWLLEADKVKIVPDAKDYIQGYLYNNKVAMDSTDVIHFRRANANNQYYGTSAVMECLADPLLLEAYGIGDLKAFYENSSVGSGVLSSEFPLTQQQITSIKEQFTNLYSKDSGKRHSTIILPNNMKYTSMKLSPKDSMLLDSLQISDDRVLRTFKVHKMLLGGDVDGYSTKVDDVAKLCFNTAIRPITSKIASQFQLFFRKTLKTQNLYVICDYDEIPYISDAIAEKAEHVSTLIACGTLSWNEGRDVLGLPRVDNENYDKRFFPAYLLSGTPVSIDDYQVGMTIGAVNQQPVAPTTPNPNGGNNATASAV